MKGHEQPKLFMHFIKVVFDLNRAVYTPEEEGQIMLGLQTDDKSVACVVRGLLYSNTPTQNLME